MISLPTLFSQFIETNENTSIECFEQHGAQPGNKRWHPDANLAQKLNQTIDIYSLAHNNYMGVSFLPCLFCSIILDTFNLSYRGRTWTLDCSWKLPIQTRRLKRLNKKLKRTRNQLQKKMPIQVYPRLLDTIQPLTQYNGQYSDDISHLIDFFKDHSNSNKLLLSYNNEKINQFNQFLIELKYLRDSALEAIKTSLESICLESRSNQMNASQLEEWSLDLLFQ